MAAGASNQGLKGEGVGEKEERYEWGEKKSIGRRQLELDERFSLPDASVSMFFLFILFAHSFPSFSDAPELMCGAFSSPASHTVMVLDFNSRRDVKIDI